MHLSVTRRALRLCPIAIVFDGDVAQNGAQFGKPNPTNPASLNHQLTGHAEEGFSEHSQSQSLQLGVLRLGFLQDGDVGVGLSSRARGILPIGADPVLPRGRAEHDSLFA
jgi:hypothetical protein